MKECGCSRIDRLPPVDLAHNRRRSAPVYRAVTFVQHCKTCTGSKLPTLRAVYEQYSKAYFYVALGGRKRFMTINKGEEQNCCQAYITVVAVQTDYMSLLRKTDCICAATGVSPSSTFLYFAIRMDGGMKRRHFKSR